MQKRCRIPRIDVLEFIARTLSSIREDKFFAYFPFVFLWVDGNKALDIYVEADNGAFRYHITSDCKTLSDMVRNHDCPSIEEFNLTTVSWVDSRTRIIHTIEPGLIGCGSLCQDYLDDNFDPIPSLKNAIFNLVSKRK